MEQKAASNNKRPRGWIDEWEEFGVDSFLESNGDDNWHPHYFSLIAATEACRYYNGSAPGANKIELCRILRKHRHPQLPVSLLEEAAILRKEGCARTSFTEREIESGWAEDERTMKAARYELRSQPALVRLSSLNLPDPFHEGFPIHLSQLAREDYPFELAAELGLQLNLPPLPNPPNPASDPPSLQHSSNPFLVNPSEPPVSLDEEMTETGGMERDDDDLFDLPQQSIPLLPGEFPNPRSRSNLGNQLDENWGEELDAFTSVYLNGFRKGDKKCAKCSAGAQVRCAQCMADLCMACNEVLHPLSIVGLWTHSRFTLPGLEFGERLNASAPVSLPCECSSNAPHRTVRMTLVLFFSRVVEGVEVTYHDCNISLACHLLAAGWMPSSPQTPKIAFHMSLIEVGYHAAFGQGLSATALSEIVAMMHLEVVGDAASPRRDQLNEALHIFKVLYERRKRLKAAGLVRPENPFCAACSSQVHALSYDVCFGLKRLNTRSTRHVTLVENGIVKPQAEVDAYLAQCDQYAAGVERGLVRLSFCCLVVFCMVIFVNPCW